MRPLPYFKPVLAALAVMLIAALAWGSCERGGASIFASAWTHTSAKAPYVLAFDAKWRMEEPTLLNSDADIAASVDNVIFLIVIPQELPTTPPLSSPVLADASLAMMEESFEGLTVQRQGLVQVDGREGTSVFFRATIEGQPIQYIATYVADGAWGYQIIGWAPAAREAQLAERVDEALRAWRFASAGDAGMLRAPSPTPAPSPAPAPSDPLGDMPQAFPLGSDDEEAQLEELNPVEESGLVQEPIPGE